MSPKPKVRLEDALTKARQRLNGAAGLPFPTEASPEEEAKATSPATPENAPAPAGSPQPDEPGRRDGGDQD